MNNSPAKVNSTRRERPVGFPGNSRNHPYVIAEPQRASVGFPGNTHDHPFVIDQTHIYCIDATYPGRHAPVVEGTNLGNSGKGKSKAHDNGEEKKPSNYNGNFVIYHRLSCHNPPAPAVNPRSDEAHRAPECSGTQGINRYSA
ncbi:hypothetical protein Pst134EA_015122 [Puccinia striiformis f. sp. tritici]|nr:hypothetical protein Pst134EA_015122 [Puccinia striiformis f. sp. tritici]KAH9463034.1 hypothetical protein Pst134EA_015122 [Puccinia striiformis f. sp. tritici]KAI9603143.1 hypothetical protein H4Q26_002457 [Puccinia striiformis f. sp. tritici PST-130]KNF04321.1 hypothetical protein PSTG_02663 [Puccinia striiformis f. sp. tritici PST-78]KNF04322.1 hypothetical protein PSTG_02664 [Puccinia striiformis f. sp. tritici PST-78]